MSWLPYFDMRLRTRDGVRVVTSSGVFDDVTDWKYVPNHSVLELTGRTLQFADISSFSVPQTSGVSR